MFKFIKYEIKGTYKFILGLLAALILAFTIIQSKAANPLTGIMGLEDSNGMSGAPNLTILLSVLVIVGAFITAFFYIISSYRKELYEDRGYLTFSLPLSGGQILGGKILTALFWYFVIAGVTILYNGILSTILFKIKWSEVFQIIREFVGLSGISLLVSGLISVILTLITIYFAMTLGKVSFKNRKIGGIWFIIFLVLDGFIGYLVGKISLALPYFLDLGSLKIVSQNQIVGMGGIGLDMRASLSGAILTGFGNNIHLNVVGTLAQVIIGIAMFMGTAYLLEEKIDL